MAVGCILTFLDVAIRAAPEACDAVEVIAEAARWVVDNAPVREIVAPWIAVHCASDAGWFRGSGQLRNRRSSRFWRCSGCWLGGCRGGMRDGVSRIGVGVVCRGRRRRRIEGRMPTAQGYAGQCAKADGCNEAARHKERPRSRCALRQRPEELSYLTGECLPSCSVVLPNGADEVDNWHERQKAVEQTSHAHLTTRGHLTPMNQARKRRVSAPINRKQRKTENRYQTSGKAINGGIANRPSKCKPPSERIQGSDNGEHSTLPAIGEGSVRRW